MYNIEGSQWVRSHLQNTKGKTVLEFGNQRIWEHAKPILETTYDVARDWYVNQLEVAEYKSVDINGEDGAIGIDLAKQIPEEYENLFGHFDVVTNVGSTEHFGKEPEKQWQAFCNATLLTCIGGVTLHQLVPTGQWLDHCDVWYRDGIGEVLARHLGCYLIEENRVNLRMLNPAVDYICVALWKYKEEELPSMPPKDFVEKLSW